MVYHVAVGRGAVGHADRAGTGQHHHIGRVITAGRRRRRQADIHRAAGIAAHIADDHRAAVGRAAVGRNLKARRRRAGEVRRQVHPRHREILRRRRRAVTRDEIGERGGTADDRGRAAPADQQAARAGEIRCGVVAAVKTRQLADAVQHQIGHRIGRHKVQVQHRAVAHRHGRVGGQRGLHQPQRARAHRRVAGVAAAAGQRQRAAAQLGQAAAGAVRVRHQRQSVRDVIGAGMDDRAPGLHEVCRVDGRAVGVEQKTVAARRQRPAVEIKRRTHPA